MIEEWKDIVGYEGLYQISNLGRIKSLPKQLKNKFGLFISKEKILKPSISSSGYLTVKLCSHTGKKPKQVHQLVCESFLNHKPCGMSLVIDHINNIKTNNELGNLRVVTNRFNTYRTQGSYTSIYKGVSYIKNKKLWKAQIRLRGKVITIGYFKKEIDAKKAYESKLDEIIKP